MSRDAVKYGAEPPPTRAELKLSIFMRVAHVVAEAATCRRGRVGAVLVRADGSVAGTGYNGALPGLAHCDDSTCTPQRRCLRTRHAERSALDFSRGDVAAAFVTHEPCLRCTQDLVARGVRDVYFGLAYEGSPEEAERRKELLSEAGVAWHRMRLLGSRHTGDIDVHWTVATGA